MYNIEFESSPVSDKSTRYIITVDDDLRFKVIESDNYFECRNTCLSSYIYYCDFISKDEIACYQMSVYIKNILLHYGIDSETEIQKIGHTICNYLGLKYMDTVIGVEKIDASEIDGYNPKYPNKCSYRNISCFMYNSNIYVKVRDSFISNNGECYRVRVDSTIENCILFISLVNDEYSRVIMPSILNACACEMNSYCLVNNLKH